MLYLTKFMGRLLSLPKADTANSLPRTAEVRNKNTSPSLLVNLWQSKVSRKIEQQPNPWLPRAIKLEHSNQAICYKLRTRKNIAFVLSKFKFSRSTVHGTWRDFNVISRLLSSYSGRVTVRDTWLLMPVRSQKYRKQIQYSVQRNIAFNEEIPHCK